MNEHDRLVGQLRTALANKISDTKAYDVPALCERLGLRAGTGEEAFSSKFRYASARLKELRADRVVDAARLLLHETDSFEIAELLARLDEYDRTHVSELTRRRILGLFQGHPLATEVDHMEFIKRLWPVADMPSPYGGSERSRIPSTGTRSTTMIGRNRNSSNTWGCSRVRRDSSSVSWRRSPIRSRRAPSVRPYWLRPSTDIYTMTGSSLS